MKKNEERGKWNFMKNKLKSEILARKPFLAPEEVLKIWCGVKNNQAGMP